MSFSNGPFVIFVRAVQRSASREGGPVEAASRSSSGCRFGLLLLTSLNRGQSNQSKDVRLYPIDGGVAASLAVSYRDFNREELKSSADGSIVCL